jgi:hypothetical protein
VIGSAGDPPTAGGDDFDEFSVSDFPGRDDWSPFSSSFSVVEGKHSWELAGSVDISDSGIPRFCQNSGISTQTIDRLASDATTDAHADQAAALLGLPPASGP